MEYTFFGVQVLVQAFHKDPFRRDLHQLIASAPVEQTLVDKRKFWKQVTARLGEAVPLCEVLQHSVVGAFFQALADRLWREGTGSASRPAWLHLLAEPPSIDHGEVTDKGSINQRAVLAHRAALIEVLYEGAGVPVIVPHKEAVS